MTITSSLISTLLFIAAGATIASATRSEPSRAQAPASFDMVEPTRLFLFTPPREILPKIEQCWLSILKVEGCAAELLSSSTKMQVNVTRDCCDAVVSFGDGCFVAVFTNSPFSPLFPPLLKAFCNAIFSNTGRNSSKISPPPAD